VSNAESMAYMLASEAEVELADIWYYIAGESVSRR
jgi:hypothetical protein